jgi:RND family efflux transporter MFP subunit
MRLRSKLVALIAVPASLLGLSVLAQAPGNDPSRVAARPTGSVEVVSGYLDVVQRSDVAALREGVLEKLELQVGFSVKQDDHIGMLYKKTAELNRRKAEVVAAQKGMVNKAEAQKKQAVATLARLKRLQGGGTGYVSLEEMEKAAADVEFAYALIQEATETREVNQAELDIAQLIEREHEIKAPISGIITEILKHPGEGVRAGEAVARIVNIDKLRFVGYVPIESALRLREGDVVQVRPLVESAELPIERLSIPAKITFISPEAQVVGRTEVQVHALLDNPTGDTGSPLLRNGLKAEMTINFGAPRSAVGAR